jgi:acyl-coenzyme A thioesterase PaaI-like protein
MTDDVPPLSPVPADPAGVAALVQARLSELAGAEVRPVSLSLDFGPACGEAREGRMESWVDRRTRSLAFVRARLAAVDGRMIAAGSAVFSRPPTPA